MLKGDKYNRKKEKAEQKGKWKAGRFTVLNSVSSHTCGKDRHLPSYDINMVSKYYMRSYHCSVGMRKRRHLILPSRGSDI